MDYTQIFEELSESISDIIGTLNNPSEKLINDLEIKQEELTSIIYQLTNNN